MKNPFIRNHSLFHYGFLDMESMQMACNILLEYKDFTSFSKLHTQTKTNNCIISEANWQQYGDNLVFTISADRFLRNMVRAIVGTMLEIGKGTLSIEGFREVIESRNRSNAGFSVSGHALFLENVSYPDKIFLNQSND
jgi:tRNA pseudouridine38-40 synthase